MKRFAFKSKVWLYPGDAAWHFATVPAKESATIKEAFGSPRRGWGAVRVEAKIGKTAWKTSIFPDSKSGTYLLPLKKDVREREEILSGDTIDIRLAIER